jgi:hypothetical protein
VGHLSFLSISDEPYIVDDTGEAFHKAVPYVPDQVKNYLVERP